MPSGSFAVLALNCLQKSMMFKPCGPKAVPTGGAGVALPAGNCNLIVVCTFLAMSLASNPYLRLRHPAPEQYFLSKLFNAGKIQFHRRRTPENRYRYLQPAVVAVDLLDRALEILKPPLPTPHFPAALAHT